MSINYMPHEPLLTVEIFELVSEITDLVWQYSTRKDKLSQLHFYRSYSLQAGLLIDHIQLPLDDIMSLFDNPYMTTTARGMKVAQNLVACHSQLSLWRSYCFNDFQTAHKLMMKGLMDCSSLWRKGGVEGVAYRQNKLIHIAPAAKDLMPAMQHLFQWLKSVDIHPLILSAIVHYEIQYLMPFVAGNGRIARFWHTLILHEWHAKLMWLPLDKYLHLNQANYFAILAESVANKNSTKFITFMLQSMKKALQDILSETIKVPRRRRALNDEMLNMIIDLMKKHPKISIVTLSDQLDVGHHLIQKSILILKQRGMLSREGSVQCGYWRVMEHSILAS